LKKIWDFEQFEIAKVTLFLQKFLSKSFHYTVTITVLKTMFFGFEAVTPKNKLKFLMLTVSKCASIRSF